MLALADRELTRVLPRACLRHLRALGFDELAEGRLRRLYQQQLLLKRGGGGLRREESGLQGSEAPLAFGPRHAQLRHPLAQRRVPRGAVQLRRDDRVEQHAEGGDGLGAR